jgi:hypothetical protein
MGRERSSSAPRKLSQSIVALTFLHYVRLAPLSNRIPALQKRFVLISRVAPREEDSDEDDGKPTNKVGNDFKDKEGQWIDFAIGEVSPPGNVEGRRKNHVGNLLKYLISDSK